jgi:group I intron endonuclease
MRKIIIPKCGGVYKIMNLVNGKVYIGSAQNLHNRRKIHFQELRRGTNSIHLQAAYYKYGERNFGFIIIEFVEDLTQLTSREQYWIDCYKSYDR